MDVLQNNLPDPIEIVTRITGFDVDAKQTFTILALPEGGFRAARKVFDTFLIDVLVIEEVFESETFGTLLSANGDDSGLMLGEHLDWSYEEFEQRLIASDERWQKVIESERTNQDGEDSED